MKTYLESKNDIRVILVNEGEHEGLASISIEVSSITELAWWMKTRRGSLRLWHTAILDFYEVEFKTLSENTFISVSVRNLTRDAYVAMVAAFRNCTYIEFKSPAAVLVQEVCNNTVIGLPDDAKFQQGFIPYMLVVE